MVSVAQGRRERKGFAEWWFYSPTEAIITHFMRKLGSRVRTEGRASMVAKNLWIFRNVTTGPLLIVIELGPDAVASGSRLLGWQELVPRPQSSPSTA